MCDDAQIVAAIMENDPLAFRSLMERHRDAVLGLCLRVTGNPRDAEEIAHDAFVEAWLKLDQLRDANKLLPWLRSIALNRCRMWIRRNLSMQPEPVEEAAPEEEIDSSLVRRMTNGLMKLSAAHRIALVLHYYEGLSYKEIATFLEVPVGTVMSRLHRARRALKAIVHDASEEEITMFPKERWGEEVSAEIEVLVQMYGSDRSAMERLSVILRRAPDRFAALIRNPEEESVLDQLALIMPRLGAPATSVATTLLFGSDVDASKNAASLLERVVTAAQPMLKHAAAPSVYLLTDALLQSHAKPAAKVAVLLTWAEICPDEASASLFLRVLLGWPDEAFSILIERFETDDLEQLRKSRVLAALCRIGTPFCRAVTAALSEEPTLLRGLLGARMLADVPIEADALAEMTDRVGALLSHDSSDVRCEALWIVGALKATAYSEVVREQLTSDVPELFMAAIRTVAELGDRAAADQLLEIAKSDSVARRAAIEALARLRVEEATAVLIQLLDDDDPKTSYAAISALKEIGSEEADRALQNLLGHRDKKLRKAAAIAIYRERRRPPESKPSAARELYLGLAHEMPSESIALDRAIREGLTELRSYEERDLTKRIAAVCSDWTATRRYLVELGLMSRSEGVYSFTPLGQTIWRVERFVRLSGA